MRWLLPRMSSSPPWFQIPSKPDRIRHMLINAAIVLILVVAAYALVRGLDVRLVLFAAALVLASLAGKPWIVLDAFRSTISNADVVGPICSAMGYAYVLKLIEADQELVRLLIAPVRHVPWLLVPAGS